ncbi:cardiolipin synthase [Ascidiimonas sp. W6]|uniref:cardiolipin synthase n=1 Tax=Ascidiimonas meishanensis TaxID=3128903 RepID=UPI0030EB2B18
MEFVSNHLWELSILLNYIIVIIAVITLLLGNLSPTKTLSYLLALIVLPYVGLIFYYLFGQEYRKSKIFKRKNVLNQQNIREWKRSLELSEKRLTHFDDLQMGDKIKLVQLLKTNEEAPVTIKNKVEILINGEAKFKRLFEDIESARETIHLEYYILKDDNLGNELIALLCKKSSEGLEVRINYDSVGSSISAKTKKKLKENGVFFYPFMPVYFPRFTSKMNYRNHRKMVIIDGSIGYVGGINVSDRYVNRNSDIFWRDTHLRIEGEAVGSLQLYFMLNWDFVTEEDFKIKDSYFPKTNIKEKTAVQIAASGPDTDWASIMEAMFSAINSADKTINVCTPYFIPNEQIITALVAASKSGVEVRLIIPKKSDSWAAKYATHSYLERLLEADAKIYLYTKGFIHAKMITVDDVFTTIGTSNMDNRSFNINFEINALIYDIDITKQAIEIFENDLKDCVLLNKEVWLNRKISQRLKESFCRLWAPLL